MFPHLRHNPASLLLIGVVCGLAARPHLDGSAHLAMLPAVLALSCLSRPLRPALPLWIAGILAGLIAASIHDTRLERFGNLIESLPEDRFVTIEAPLDREWSEGRDGVWSRARRFELRTHDGILSSGRDLAIYAPASVPPLGMNDHVRLEGFLRSSRSGRFYVAVKSARLIELSQRRSAWHPRRWNRAMRARLAEHLENHPEHERAVALIRAVALGDGSSMPEALEESFRRGGTYHLLVFSGMQIAVAAGMIALLLRSLGMHRGTDVALVALALIAPVFAGDEPSVGRAATMIFAFAVSCILGRPTSISNLLFVSAILRLVVRPEELTSPGFLLTYGASFGLLVVGRTLAIFTRRVVATAAAFGAGAELCVQPLTLLFFNHYVAGGFLITIVLSPWLALIFILAIPVDLLLRAHPEAAWYLIELVAWIDHLAAWVNGLSGWLRLSGHAPSPPAWLVVGIFLGVWLTYLSRARDLTRAIAMVLLLLVAPVWVGIDARAKGGEAESIEFLDVGQGDSILIRAGKTILIDGGGSASDPGFGRRVLLPLLAERGVRSLDVVILSHPDADHCGGLPTLARSLEVRELWLSARHIASPCTQSLLRSTSARVRYVRDGQTLGVGPVELTITLPRLIYKNNASNNSSVVVTARVRHLTILLPGDVEAAAERDLVEEAGRRMKADVLKVPHHGSRTSTTAALLHAASPRLAVISCELDNLYGHPAPEVVARIREHGIQTSRTDRDGTIRIVPIDEHRFRIHTESGTKLTLTRRAPPF